MKAKDIDPLPILVFLDKSPSPAMWGGGVSLVCHWKCPPRYDFPPGVNNKLAMAKMSSLVRRGLVGGCCCGCRGDFVLTDKGKAYLVAQLKAKEQADE